MSLTAGQVIESARYSHPSFDSGLVPNSVASRFVNEAQRHLYTTIHQQNPAALVKRWVIALLPKQNIAQVGAGTGFGAPLVQGLPLRSSDSNVGSLATLSDASAVQVSPRAVTSATSTTLTDSTASWMANDYAGMLVQIVAGTGSGQVRDIVSNTSDTATLLNAWTVVPDPTSVYQIQTNIEAVTGEVGVQLGPHQPIRQVQSWLVQLDSAGQPYLDLSHPIQVPMTEAIPLPPHYYVDHGIVRFAKLDSQQADPDRQYVLTLTTPDQQTAPPRPYSATVVDGKLQLLRPFEQWQRVVAIELPYLPLCPTVTSANTLLLLPEASEEALVSRVAMRMGERASAMGRISPQQNAGLVALARQNEESYVAMTCGAGRGLVQSIQVVW